jgi:signal transduction histidine kinase
MTVLAAPRSLRVRLLLGGAIWITLALVAAGLFIVASFDQSMDAARRDDLQASLDRLVAAIDPEGGALSIPAPLTDPRFDTPLGGFYWQINDRNTGKISRSRSLWDFELPVAGIGDTQGQVMRIAGPNGRAAVVLTRAIRLEGNKGERRFSVAVAEGADQDKGPIRRFGTDLTVALVLLGAVLLVAAWLQVHFGLLPLGILQRQIDAIRRGEAARLPERGQSPELALATEQINELLEAQDASISFARERAADLAHGLKTPLSILSATSERLRQEGDRTNADLLQMLSDQMNARIDYQLRIARLRYRTRAQGANSSVNDVVLRAVAVLRKSLPGEKVNWIVGLDGRLQADMDEHDLLELVGIILENASQWAETRVQVTGSAHDDEVIFSVEDDGAGMNEADVSRLGVRGARLDESSPGDGLGLSIAYQIVRLNRGRIDINRGRLGGLGVTICLPQSRMR